MLMTKNSDLLDKVILFLIVIVSLIFAFGQYQFFRILGSSLLSYLSILLIIALAGAIIWLFTAKRPHHAEQEAHHPIEKHEPTPLTLMEKINFGLVAVIALLILLNQVQLSQATALAGLKNPLVLKTSSTKTSLALTGDPNQDAMTVVIPRGSPFYGESLGVSFDDPIRSLEVIAQLDPAYGKAKVQLTPEEKQRYINIGTVKSMGCQYCCGADTLVTKSGSPTCGCKHSWAMRGIIAYLVKNYPDLSDEEIMREASKWKGLFFPKQMITKYIQEAQAGQFSPDIASLLLDVDDEKLAEMKAVVASQPQTGAGSTAANIDELPNMVGGC